MPYRIGKSETVYLCVSIEFQNTQIPMPHIPARLYTMCVATDTNFPRPHSSRAQRIRLYQEVIYGARHSYFQTLNAVPVARDRGGTATRGSLDSIADHICYIRRRLKGETAALSMSSRVCVYIERHGEFARRACSIKVGNNSP